MKKYLLIIFVAAAVCVGMATSGRHTITPGGRLVTAERTVGGNFDGIGVSEGITVYLRQGAAVKVVVRSDERAMDYIETDVRSGKLRIRYADNVQVRRIKTAVYVTAPNISSLSVSSGADIKIKGELSGETLSVSAASAGDVEGAVAYRSVSVSASSGGDVNLHGTADRVKASASSGSDIDLGNLKANIVSASASSGADIDVWAVEQINASASSGADISYRGNPQTRSISRSSGGVVTSRH